MEKLQSSRPWRGKINGPSVMARSDYNDVFSVPPWQTAHAPFSIRLDDYSEIFDAASFASIPLLDLSMVENGFETVGDSSGGCRAGVDYLDIFGSIGAGGFAASNEELFAESKTSGVSCTGRRTRWDVLPEQQEKEASVHPLKLYTENYEPNLEMKQHSSFPRQSDDVRSTKFSMSHHRMSQETIDNESKNKAVNKGTIDNTGAKGYTPGGGQKNFAVNPPEPNCASLLDVPRDEKPNSQSHSYHATSHDVACLKVSEISLQTKPFKGPPPTRPPPTLSMKPEHPKVLSTDLRDDVEEGSSLKSKVNNQLHFSSEATKTHTIDDSINGFSLLHDTEMDPSSAAAVSIAAIEEAMEQAQVRLMIAKKLMDRKRAKSHWKVGPSKAMNNEEDGTSDEVTLKSCSKGIDSNNLLKESNTNIECTFVESEVIRTGVKIHLNHEDRKMQLSSCRKDQQQVSKDNTSRPFVEREEIRTTQKIPLNLEDRKLQLPICKKDEQQVRKENSSKSSELTCKIVDVAGEWKIDNEYYELLRNGGFFSTVKGIHIQGDEEKAKAAICSCEDREKHGKDSEQAIEVEQKQKTMEVIVCIEKLEKDNQLKVPSFDCMEEADKNLADANMDEFLHKDQASDLEKDYGPLLSDENQKQCETHHDKNNENNVNKLDSVVDCCLYEEKIKELGSNICFKPWVANGNCEDKNLQAAERKFNVSLVECDINESNKEVKVQNETLCYDVFEKKIKEPDELCSFNTTNRKGVDEEIKPSNHYENEARSMKHQDSCSAYRFEIEEDDNATEKDENDEFQTNEEAHILVENNLEQEAIQDENGLENGLEIPEAQGKIKDAELEKILNSREGTCRNDCNEKETREVRTSFQKDDESVGAHMNQGVKISEFLASAEGVCGKSVSEKITVVPVLVETQISSNSADEACQLGEIEESDTGKVCSSGKEGSLLAAAQDATRISHVEKAGNYRHFLYTEAKENKSKMNVDWERDRAPETCLEEKDLDREKERERIAAERANYKASQQELAEALVRAERIAVERATAEARQRALAESRQKAEKAAEAEKASREARLRAERAAVERATEEARKRAIEKALAEKAAVDARERTAQVSASNKNRSRNDVRTEHFKVTRTQQDSEAKYKPTLAKNQQNAQSTSSANDNIYSDSHNNVGGAESKLNKASKERQQQTSERAAKALAERNMRDILAQREQVERDRLAESLDGEVRRWSIGKDGNLRALLSTLQYILGPESGWQPIPLTDIMNASAAKKAYRKATLCVHPDKLQQRGASIQQKYICEKLFDLLQEAWNKFNSEER